jgi:NitT/TauT family transport system ATP-binding protein
MIVVDDLTVAFENVTAVEDIDLRVNRGEFVTVVGPSGCGKTTLLRAIGGLQSPTEGSVTVDSDSPATLRENGNVGFVFQEHTLFPWKTTLENVQFLRRMAGKAPDEATARSLLETVGLAEFLDAYPRELSGGMKQRVAIVRALHLDADVLLLDEPFGALDEITRDELGVELRRLHERERKTTLFVTHSVPEATFLGDRCIVVRGSPGHIEATFDIDFPNERDTDLFGTIEYQKQVAEIRSGLYDDEEGQ